MNDKSYLEYFGFSERRTRYGYFHIYENFDIDGTPRKLKIYIPSFYKRSHNRYPVVYLNDGHTVFDAGGMSPWSWNVHKSLDYLIRSKLIEPLIAVAIYPIDRTYEYLTVKNYIEWTGETIAGGGGLKYYSQYLAQELKPYIDENYKTDPSPEKTTIVGSSFGAIASLFTACVHNYQFGNAGVLSPAFFEIWFEQNRRNFRIEYTGYMNTIRKALASCEKKPKLWFDWGINEGLDEPDVPYLGRKVIKIFTQKYGYKKGSNLFYFEDKIGTHDERAWAHRFLIMMKKFYGRKRNYEN